MQWKVKFSLNFDHSIGNFSSTIFSTRREFCDIPFNEFTFPGAHNSGTGQMDDPNFPCLYKNQDLTVREQLDFGIRFLDLDIIYSQGGRCRGLETGTQNDWGTGFFPSSNTVNMMKYLI